MLNRDPITCCSPPAHETSRQLPCAGFYRVTYEMYAVAFEAELVRMRCIRLHRSMGIERGIMYVADRVRRKSESVGMR